MCFLRGELHHLFRQPLGHQLIRVMLAHEPSVGALDLGLIRLGADAQECISLFEGGALGFGLTPARPGASSATGPCPGTSLAGLTTQM